MGSAMRARLPPDFIPALGVGLAQAASSAVAARRLSLFPPRLGLLLLAGASRPPLLDLQRHPVLRTAIERF